VRRPLLPPPATGLPGSRQRQRALQLLALAGLTWLLRPWLPFQLLPGWVVGALVLWALLELLRWTWRPQRWR
jgi:hypothetical protein